MLHKLSLEANGHILLARIGIAVYEYIFSFGERILLEYRTHDDVLSNSMVQPMTLRCCVFNKVYLVNHWHNILKCCLNCRLVFIDRVQ